MKKLSWLLLLALIVQPAFILAAEGDKKAVPATPAIPADEEATEEDEAFLKDDEALEDDWMGEDEELDWELEEEALEEGAEELEGDIKEEGVPAAPVAAAPEKKKK